MNYTVIGEFSDEAKSGKDRERSGLDQAIKSAQENQAVLVFRDLSRVSRDVRDMLDIREELLDGGAGLVDLETRIDTSTPAGKMVYTILVAAKQYQREETSAKTSEAVLFKQRNGQRISSRVPYGYRSSGKLENGKGRIVPDEREQRLIADVRKMAAEGMAQNAIKRLMNKNKVSIRGGQWHISTVQRMLEEDDVKVGQA